MGLRDCSSCGGNVRVKTFACAKFGGCSIEKDVGLKVCGDCHEKQPLELHAARKWRDIGSAFPMNKRKFNSSVIRYRDRLVMASRICEWQGWSAGRLAVGYLSEDFRSAKEVHYLNTVHERSMFGAEDPRLFIHQDRLHIAFSGVMASEAGPVVSQLYARLTESLEIEEVFYPELRGRQPWEKNWGFFSHGDELLAVYKIGGHIVLRIDGNRAEVAYQSPAPKFPAGIGEQRGGASPVKRGNEWYSFFHDVQDHERREYNLCWYTFEDKPPFRINRIGKAPLFSATKKHRPNEFTPDVFFPCGAYLDTANWCWQVSGGYYDQWSMMLSFDVNQLETLADIAPGGRDSAYTFRDNLDDLDVWQNVYNRNEYELPERIDGWRIVDVGGHIGSFARLCLDRGASHVTSIEAHPEQQKVYRQNVAAYPGQWTLIPAAVFGSPPAATATLVGRGCIAKVLGDSDRTGGQPVTDSQEVPTVTLGAVECDLLKIDVEGCEYEILGNSDLSGVQRICGEGHLFEGLPGIEWLQKMLEARGFIVRIHRTGPLTFLFWAHRLPSPNIATGSAKSKPALQVTLRTPPGF